MTTHHESLPQPPATPSSKAADNQPPARVLRSEELLGGAGLAIVVHRGQTYRLRQTRLGKLILTK